jgi:hypothetical protein
MSEEIILPAIYDELDWREKKAVRKAKQSLMFQDQRL